MVEQKKSITMKDVAQEARVNVGTVSRMINKEKGIKEVTLQKVEQAIKTLNYIPDYYARGMKKNRTETIALILPSVWHPFFSEYAMHVENEVDKRLPPGVRMLLNVRGKVVKLLGFLKACFLNAISVISFLAMMDCYLTEICLLFSTLKNSN